MVAIRQLIDYCYTYGDKKSTIGTLRNIDVILYEFTYTNYSYIAFFFLVALVFGGLGWYGNLSFRGFASVNDDTSYLLLQFSEEMFDFDELGLDSYEDDRPIPAAILTIYESEDGTVEVYPEYVEYIFD